MLIFSQTTEDAWIRMDEEDVSTEIADMSDRVREFIIYTSIWDLCRYIFSRKKMPVNRIYSASSLSHDTRYRGLPVWEQQGFLRLRQCGDWVCEYHPDMVRYYRLYTVHWGNIYPLLERVLSDEQKEVTRANNKISAPPQTTTIVRARGNIGNIWGLFTHTATASAKKDPRTNVVISLSRRDTQPESWKIYPGHNEWVFVFSYSHYNLMNIKSSLILMSKKTAIFLWRFQPFHIGHMSIVDHIFQQGFERLVIIIGSSDKSVTDENPWTVQEREAIIRASIPLELQEKVDITLLADFSDDDVWCENLLQIFYDYRLQITDYRLFTGNYWVKNILWTPQDWDGVDWLYYWYLRNENPWDDATMRGRQCVDYHTGLSITSHLKTLPNGSVFC
jgi:cytidyltransferase-like protein